MDLTLSDYFQSYQAYGVTFMSNLPLAPWLGISNQSGHLVIECQVVAKDLYIPDCVPLFRSPQSDRLGQPFSRLYRFGVTLYFLLPMIGGFFIEPDKIRVQIRPETNLVVVCAAVLSYAFTLWLEQHKIRCLHAATLCFHGQAAAFMADSAIGKSTLAAALIQAGAELLGDDIAPLTETMSGFMVSPAYPTMRLSKSQADQFLGTRSGLACWFPALDKFLIPIGADGWGTYRNTLQKLQRVYILERNSDIRSGEIRFEPLTKTAAILALVRFSFGRRSPLALGIATERMAFFARLVEQVAVVRLIYSSGYEYLADVVRMVIRDMDKNDSL